MSAPPPSPTGELLDALERLGRVLNEHKTDDALIGGSCVALRGEIRATRDIAMLASVPQIELPRVLESLVDLGFDVDVPRAIRMWTREHLLDFAFGYVRVDWIKAVLPAFRRIPDRARWEEVSGRPVRAADAEGLLVLKLIAFRPRDQEDIRGILAANAGTLDLGWVRRELAGVTEDGDPRHAQFEPLVREFYEEPR